MPQNRDKNNVSTETFEDNFNVLSQIINNYPATNYTDGITETDSSLSTNNSHEQEKIPLTNGFRYYLLIFFSTIYLIYGCQNSLLGPALPDLAKILHTSSENISIAVSLKCLIFSISTILVSFSFKLFGNRQIQYAIGVLAVGLITGFTPFMTSFKQYLVAAVCSGFVTAFIDSVTNLVVLELFSLNSKVYMQIAHGAFTVGTIFGPLIIGPFLSKTNSTIPSNHSDVTTTVAPITTTTLDPNTTITTISPITTTLTDNILLNSTINNLKDDTLKLSLSLDTNSTNFNLNDTDEFETRIQIPYLIISTLLILAAILMLISQKLYPYIPEKRKLFAKNKSKRLVEPLEEQIGDSIASSSSSSQEISQSSANHSSNASKSKPKMETVCQEINLPKIYYRIFLGLTGLLLSIYSCIDGVTGMFMPSFLSKGELKIEKNDAAFMASIIYMAMAIGRLLTIIFALKTTCKIMLFLNLSMILCGYITLTFFAIHSKFITWISMIVIGSGLSSTYPLILSYIENRIVITNTVQLYLLFVSVIFLTFMPIFVGHFIDTAPMMFTYSNLGLAVTALILMLLIHATDIWKRKLIRKIKEDQQNLVGEDEE